MVVPDLTMALITKWAEYPLFDACVQGGFDTSIDVGDLALLPYCVQSQDLGSM